jgi:hypothetical protein
MLGPDLRSSRRKGSMPNRSQEVNRFMKRLNHPLKEGVEQLRTVILDSNDRITEHIKWNAPSQPSARGRDDGHSRATDHAAVAESLLELEETG